MLALRDYNFGLRFYWNNYTAQKCNKQNRVVKNAISKNLVLEEGQHVTCIITVIAPNSGPNKIFYSRCPL